MPPAPLLAFSFFFFRGPLLEVTCWCKSMLLSPSLLSSRDLFFSVSTDSSRLLGPAPSGKEVLLLSPINVAAFVSLLIPRSPSSEQLFTFLALEPSAPIKQI